MGNVLSETDPLGRTTEYLYDARGSLMKTTNPLGDSIDLTYDPAGNLLATTDELDRTTTFTYDTLGGQTAVTDPHYHTITTAEYDANSNVTSVLTSTPENMECIPMMKKDFISDN